MPKSTKICPNSIQKSFENRPKCVPNRSTRLLERVLGVSWEASGGVWGPSRLQDGFKTPKVKVLTLSWRPSWRPKELLRLRRMRFLITNFWPHLGPLNFQFLTWTWPHVGSQLGPMLAQVGLKLASCWLKLAQVGLMLAQVGSNWNYVRKMIEFWSKIDDFEGKLELPKRENCFKNQWFFKIFQIDSCVQKVAASWVKLASSWLKLVSSWPQVGLKLGSCWLKMASCWLQMASKIDP